MLKLLRIRSWIGLMAMLIVGAGIFGIQDRLAGWWASGPSWWSGAQEERDWRQQELAFLKGIYDRLERQRQSEGGDAPASLRREQEAILKRLAETAKPIRDKVPPEIRALLPDSPGPEPAKAFTPAEPVTATAAPVAVAAVPTEPLAVPTAPPPLPEVRIELGSLPRMDVGLSASSRYIEIDRPIEQIVKVREPRPAKSSETKAREANAAEAKSDETKAETKSTQPKLAKPKPAKPKPAATAPETGGSATE